ncbi:hypothetical protein CFP59_07215 [Streptomyces malaysiensis subsp. malaysiensis]|uniref:Uncharacterized protein n=1 Tax=Streptomyces malaysiensis TaxID=92644 RepID=A0A2J7Z747_STRMQ|nr:hypothetical protein CFP59_07215 [Streptomyces sp. M56]PNG96097.1 hypothetical protein SMF913_12122 [Streptomyces malaysiensis]
MAPLEQVSMRAQDRGPAQVKTLGANVEES